MTLVDTSVWIQHLRSDLPALRRALEGGEVLAHPHVVGELACGHLRGRAAVLELLAALPVGTVASHDETLACIEHHRLHGKGLGWIDAHLVASALLTPAVLWTLDGALAREARRCGIRAR